MDFLINKVLIVTSIEHRDDGNGRPLTIGYSHCCWLQNHLWYIGVAVVAATEYMLL